MESLGPSADDALEGEAGGFASTIAAVENGAVDESSLIVAGNGVGGCGFDAECRCEHFVLQTGFGDFHAFSLGVFGEEVFAGFACGLACSFLLFAQEFLHETLGLHFGHFEFFTIEHLLDGAGEFTGDESFDVHPFEVVANDQAEGVREFFHKLRSELSFSY